MTTDAHSQLTWSAVCRNHDPSDPLTIYDADGTAWSCGPGGGAWRNSLIRQNGNDSDTWTPDDDETVWIDSPAVPEPPDGTRIEFEHNTDVYAAWRDDESSGSAGWATGDGGVTWCLYGQSVPVSWAVMWLMFGDSLRTLVRLVPVADDVPNYDQWPTAQVGRAQAGAAATAPPEGIDPMTEPITKLSANMSPRSMAALNLAAELTGDSRTDCLNRAIQLYALYAQTKADGGRFLVQDRDRYPRPIELD